MRPTPSARTRTQPLRTQAALSALRMLVSGHMCIVTQAEQRSARLASSGLSRGSLSTVGMSQCGNGSVRYCSECASGLSQWHGNKDLWREACTAAHSTGAGPGQRPPLRNDAKF